MNSEKVKEIKKALEHCGEKITCRGCPEYNNEPVIDWFECKKKLLHKTITLINELESENEELKRYETDWLNSEKMHLQADIEDTEFELASSNRLFEIVSKENKELKDRIAELEKENAKLTLERDVLISKKIAEHPKTKESIVAPIYVLPNTATPEMVLKLGEKCLVCQFAERMKEKIKENVNSENVNAFVECIRLSEEILKEFLK